MHLFFIIYGQRVKHTGTNVYKNILRFLRGKRIGHAVIVAVRFISAVPVHLLQHIKQRSIRALFFMVMRVVFIFPLCMPMQRPVFTGRGNLFLRNRVAVIKMYGIHRDLFKHIGLPGHCLPQRGLRNKRVNTVSVPCFDIGIGEKP